jgi:hypothetical protein
MRLQYSPEVGLVLRFEGDEIPDGLEIAEGMVVMYEEQGIDCSEVRQAIEAIRHAKLTLH